MHYTHTRLLYTRMHIHTTQAHILYTYICAQPQTYTHTRTQTHVYYIHACTPRHKHIHTHSCTDSHALCAYVYTYLCVHMSIHIYRCTCILYMCIHTSVHIYRHTCILYMHLCTLIHKHTYTHMHTHMYYIHTWVFIHKHTYTGTHIIYTCTSIHKHACTHVCTDTHTFFFCQNCCWQSYGLDWHSHLATSIFTAPPTISPLTEGPLGCLDHTPVSKGSTTVCWRNKKIREIGGQGSPLWF